MIFKRIGADHAALCALLSIWICVIITCVSDERDNRCQVLAEAPRPVMIIDPGHGGLDGGAVSLTGKKESELNWQIAERLHDLAGFLGVGTLMTRNAYEIEYPAGSASISQRKKWDTRKRVALINSVSAGVLISIHQNYYPSSGPHGTQVLYNAVQGGRAMAKMIQDRFSVIADTGGRNAAAADNSIYIMSHAVCPAVLVECGFLSNPREAELLESEEYQMRLAVGIAAAFYDYTGDELS